MPTCWNFHVYLHAKELHHYFLYCTDIANSLLWLLWECLIMLITNDNITLQENLIPKVLKSTCTKLWYLSACKKLTSSNLFFEIWQKHCKLAILGTLGMLDHPHKNHSINLLATFMLICMQKINFITHLFLKIL